MPPVPTCERLAAALILDLIVDSSRHAVVASLSSLFSFPMLEAFIRARWSFATAARMARSTFRTEVARSRIVATLHSCHLTRNACNGFQHLTEYFPQVSLMHYTQCIFQKLTTYYRSSPGRRRTRGRWYATLHRAWRRERRSCPRKGRSPPGRCKCRIWWIRDWQ